MLSHTKLDRVDGQNQRQSKCKSPRLIKPISKLINYINYIINVAMVWDVYVIQ